MASSGTTSTRKRFTGAEFIVHFLEQQGIKIVTGIPGGSILPVYDALSQSTQIRHILARHEQGAGFIAQVSRTRSATGHTDRRFTVGARHSLSDKYRALFMASQNMAGLRTFA